MSKTVAYATVSTSVRFCEWRGLNFRSVRFCEWRGLNVSPLLFSAV